MRVSSTTTWMLRVCYYLGTNNVMMTERMSPCSAEIAHAQTISSFFIIFCLLCVTVSSSLTECACGCDKDSSKTPIPADHDHFLERRDSPPVNDGGISNHSTTPSPFNYDRVEMAEPITPVRISPPQVMSVSALYSGDGGGNNDINKYTMPANDDHHYNNDTSAITASARASRAKKVNMLRQCHMPSGLSVESDPELENDSVY
jgi:hypothetical protein